MITFTKIIEREGGYEAVYRLEDGTIVVSFINPSHEFYEALMQAIAANAISVSPRYTNEQLKQQKNEYINQCRLEAIEGGFEYDGFFWDSDEISRQNLSGIVTSIAAGLPLPEGFIYRTKQNQNVAYNAQQMVALGATMLGHVNAQYAKSFALKQQLNELSVDDSEFQDKLNAIVW